MELIIKLAIFLVLYLIARWLFYKETPIVRVNPDRSFIEDRPLTYERKRALVMARDEWLKLNHLSSRDLVNRRSWMR